MNIKPIHNEADYETALNDISQLMALDPVLGTPEGGRMDALATLVQAYEAIKFRMEQGGLSVKDLEPMIGRSNCVYEVLGRKRPLTLAMIKRLHKQLGIPAEALLAEADERFALAA